MLIGGNSAKTIGLALIDTGLIPLYKIIKALWITKGYASDLLVIQLASADNVSSMFALNVSDTKKLHLFFFYIIIYESTFIHSEL